jgi:hypothetical protein
MVCPSCQHDNEPGGKFCSQCGGTLGSTTDEHPGTSGIADDHKGNRPDQPPDSIETPAKPGRRRRAAITVAIVLVLGCGAAAYALSHTSPSSIGKNKATSSIGATKSQLTSLFFTHYRKSGITDRLVTVQIEIAGPLDHWAELNAIAKNPNLADNDFNTYAHLTNARWRLVDGSGPVGRACPTQMAAPTCKLLEKLDTPTPWQDFTATVENTQFSVTQGMGTTAVVSKIHWGTSSASFGVADVGQAVPVTYTFNFGMKKDFVAEQARETTMTSVQDGDSVPFIEGHDLVVSVCVQNTGVDMGQQFDAIESPYLQTINAFVKGTIYVANPKGISENIEDPNSVFNCE